MTYEGGDDVCLVLVRHRNLCKFVGVGEKVLTH